MMTRNIRKVVSIVCAVALLMSLCVVSMVGTTSAFKASDTPVGSELKLDFENKTGISDGTSFTNAGNTYCADPADPDNTVVKLYGNTMSAQNLEIGKADASTFDGSEAYIVQPNTKYKISFKYKFGAGSYDYDNMLTLQLRSGAQSAYAAGLEKPMIAVASFAIDPEVNTETTTVGSNAKTVNILAADTEWMTFTTIYETGDTVEYERLYISMPLDPQTAPYAKITGYVDDITIDIVDEEEDINNTLVYNFKKDSTNEYWNTKVHNLFANSNTGESYFDEAGAHLTVKNRTSASTAGGWRQKIYLYDEDHGGYKQLKAGVTYMLTLNYKVEALGSASATVGIGHTKSGSSNTNATAAPANGTGQEMAYFADGWATHNAVNMTDTKTITVVIDGDDYADMWLVVLANGSDANPNTFLIESVTVKEVKLSGGEAVVNFETNGGNAIASDILPAGTASSALPTPTHSDENKGFAGWYTDAAFTTPVGETIAAGTHTFYAKWVSEFVNVTYNNSGSLSTVKLAPGAALSDPTRPNAKMFFEGWYTDLAFTNKVTTAPDTDCTIYAKYNYTYIGYNIGGLSDASNSTTAIVTDPDDAENKAVELHTFKGSSHNIEIGNYDAEGAKAFEMLKPNTTYYIEYKVKIPAGTPQGSLTLYTGEQSKYSVDHSKTVAGVASYSWSKQSEDGGIDWVTVSGYYTTGDTFYRERVNFSVQDQFYLSLTLREGSQLNAYAGHIYIDDIIVGEYSEEVPEGAVGVYFETNSDKVAPMFGYTGEALVMPEDPVLAGYEFIGWYTDMALQSEFTGTTFGDTTITLYAKWKAVPAIYDFENFAMMGTTSDRYNHEAESNGNHYLRYNYEQGTSTSGPSGVARAILNNGGVRFNVVPGATYTVTFKYLVEETTGNATVRAVTHNSTSTWGDTKQQDKGVLTLSAATDGWQTGEFSFVADCVNENATYLSIGVNGDSTVFIDDLQIDCSVNIANLYGSTVIYLDGNGGPDVDPVSGNPGDEIWLPTPVRDGFKFGGWYTEAGLINKFTEKTYGEEGTTLYASWILGKFTEDYDNFPSAAEMGISSAYELYNSTNTDVVGFDKANVESGSTSIFRDGTKVGTKGFTLCRESSLTLGVGEQYTVTFYVKPTNVTDEAGVINLIQMSSNTSVGAPDATEVITDVGSLTVGEWQKVTYTFTASEQYIGISTSAGNDIYFDSFTVTLKGYTGRPTGDSTVSPIVIMMMVVLAAGAMVVTGKKVFAK